jgi:hypothetical protein
MSRRKPRQLGPRLDELFSAPGWRFLLVESDQDISLTLEGFEQAASALFLAIKNQHGAKAAQLIFKKIGRKESARDIARFQNLILLDQYDLMENPNVQKLARIIAEDNRALPRKEQRGSGGTNAVAIEKLIRRLLAERERDIAQGKSSKWISEQALDLFRQLGKAPHLK